MRKKTAGVVLAMTMIATMIGCGQSGSQTDTNTVASTPVPEVTEQAEVSPAAQTPAAQTKEAGTGGIYLILPSETGLSAQEEAAIYTGATKSGYRVTVKTYGNDAAKQTEAFDEAIEAGAGAIICDNIDNDTTAESVQKAKDAGIPTILMNRGIQGTGVAAAQVLTDRYACISKLAEIFAGQMGKISSFACVYHADNTTMSDDIESFTEALKSYESMKAVKKTDADEFNSEAIKETIRQLLAQNPEIDALVCANGIQARAAAEVVEETHAQMTIICLDGNDDKVSSLILSGKIYASIMKPAEDLANTAISDAVSYIKNGTTGTNERMYFAGVILTVRETIAVVSPTPVPEKEKSEDSSATESAKDNSAGSDESAVYVDLPDEEGTEKTGEADGGNTDEDGGDDEDMPVVFDDDPEEGGEGTPEMNMGE